jgi:PIN domain nuclease of toxin-antitoxin system
VRIIIDTQVLIWWTNDVSNISPRVQDIILNLDNELWLSLASIWEMQIKISLGKLDLPRALPDIITTQIEENQIKILPIELSHIYTIEQLPLHHRDPFDRLIIAQSLTEKMPIASVDKAFDVYSIERIW